MVERTRAHREANRRFGETVRSIRKRQRMKISELAERAGCSDRHIGDVEHGRKSPTLQLVCAIAEALAVQPSMLLRHLDTMHDDGYTFVRK